MPRSSSAIKRKASTTTSSKKKSLSPAGRQKSKSVSKTTAEAETVPQQKRDTLSTAELLRSISRSQEGTTAAGTAQGGAGADEGLISFFTSNFASPYIQENDFVDWLYKPHTIFSAIVGFMTVFGVISWFNLNSVAPIKAGLFAAIWAFILWGVLFLPDAQLVRPHPAAWRGWLAVAILYMMLMIFFVTLSVEDTKRVVGLYDPETLQDAPETSYATDCRISTPEEPFKFWWTVCDIFLIAHGLGYTVKMLVIRDWRVVTFISLIFEVIEVSGQHVLENFKECWWDHLIMDALICNAGGTLIGYYLLKYFRAKEYSWSKLADIKGIKSKTRRLMGQFFPREAPIDYSWRIFDSPKNLSIGFLLVCCILIEEVNCFTMKNILNLSPNHHLVVFRLCMWGFFALPGIRQFHDFAYDKRIKKLGPMAWVCATALFFETFWVCKMIYFGGYFRNPWPAHIALPWIYNIIVVAIWIPLWFKVPNKSPGLAKFLDVIFYSTIVSFIALFCMGNVDMQWGQQAFDSWADSTGLWTKSS